MKLEFQDKSSVVSALRVSYLVKLDFQDKRSVVSTIQVHFLVQLEFQDKRSVVPALQVHYLVEFDFQDKRSVVSALEVRYLMKLDFREKRYVGFPLQVRCPLNLDSRGMRWTRRSRISARYNPRWSSVVVGGGWLWLEVDEKEDQEDKENKMVEDDEDSCTVQHEVVIGGCSRCSHTDTTLAATNVGASPLGRVDRAEPFYAPRLTWAHLPFENWSQKFTQG
ncbi:uncharacterized protein LOC124293463 [Neodiprion lecontei]|uniref:Uncharacterized protein LOC124293463 n=1 Tax=Neodiprion lecontei TaxID=441921 RepID=A0ABM3FQK4_NEOLC|nr:uncharacterized protein LOC124293463 [Neodiprion lecontei]